MSRMGQGRGKVGVKFSWEGLGKGDGCEKVKIQLFLSHFWPFYFTFKRTTKAHGYKTNAHGLQGHMTPSKAWDTFP